MFTIFSSERALVGHKETFLKINGKLNEKLRSGSIKSKNCFKQLAVPFAIYADFESLLKGVRGNDKKIKLHKLKNVKHTFLAVLPTNSFALMMNLVNQLFFKGENMQSIDLLNHLLKNMIIAKK